MSSLFFLLSFSFLLLNGVLSVTTNLAPTSIWPGRLFTPPSFSLTTCRAYFALALALPLGSCSPFHHYNCCPLCPGAHLNLWLRSRYNLSPVSWVLTEQWRQKLSCESTLNAANDHAQSAGKKDCPKPHNWPQPASRNQAYQSTEVVSGWQNQFLLFSIINLI